MNIRICITLSLLILLSAKSSDKYPKDIFISPIDFPISLSGNFGDFRTNHFHSGIDIRTQGVIGKKIYACADGYISRIRISPYGYGNALYIKHANGYTTLYGHLNRFEDNIQDYIANKQYELQENSIDHFPDANEIPVKQGDVIAYSGNTGSSSGPHLHFEIRDSKTEHPLNPILFGFDIPDNVLPEIYSVYVYPIDEWTRINGRNEVQSFSAIKQDGRYVINDKIDIIGKVGVGIYAMDKFTNGKYKHTYNALSLTLDDEIIYKFKYNELEFETLRDVNSHMDLKRKRTEKKKITKCFKDPFSRLKIYEVNINDGIIELKDKDQVSVQIEVLDLELNMSNIVFELKRGESEVIDINRSDNGKKLLANKENSYYLDGASLYFPEGRLYKDWTIDVSYSKENSRIQIGPKHTPLKDWFRLKMACPDYPEALKSKLVIARDMGKRGVKAIETEFNNDLLSCKIKEFGNYKVIIDTIAPSASLLTKRLKNAPLVFKLSDNHSQFINYRADVDGKWLKLYFDYKARKLHCDPRELNLEKGKHHFTLYLTDLQGNECVYEDMFEI